jgi:hypothetical protein
MIERLASGSGSMGKPDYRVGPTLDDLETVIQKATRKYVGPLPEPVFLSAGFL